MELSTTSNGKIDLIVLDVTSDESVNDAFEFVKQNLDVKESKFFVVVFLILWLKDFEARFFF